MIQEINAYVETRYGRDKVFRFAGYLARFLAGAFREQRLSTLSDKISEFRVVLRLLDLVPMISYTRQYGFGRDETDSFVRLTTIAQNVSGLLYYPCEHMAWAAELGLVKQNASRWWVRSVWLWLLSLLLGVALSLYRLLKRRARRQAAASASSTTSPRRRKDSAEEPLRVTLLTLVGCCADLTNAIHWLPAGWLWAGRLSDQTVGLMGMISTVVSEL